MSEQHSAKYLRLASAAATTRCWRRRLTSSIACNATSGWNVTPLSFNARLQGFTMVIVTATQGTKSHRAPRHALEPGRLLEHAMQGCCCCTLALSHTNTQSDSLSQCQCVSKVLCTRSGRAIRQRPDAAHL